MSGIDPLAHRGQPPIFLHSFSSINKTFIPAKLACGFATGDCMHLSPSLRAAILISSFAGLGLPSSIHSQEVQDQIATASNDLPDAPQAQTTSSSSDQQPAQSNQDQRQEETQQREAKPTTPAGTPAHAGKKPAPEPKRILGLMPNYRAVSAGELPHPPTPKQAFMIATRNSFDYSSFVFVGITSLMAEGSNAHAQLGKGIPGYWGYYWRGYVDKTDGNYWVIFVLPTFLHEDERYYAKGEGPILHRVIYAASRVLITPDYHGKNTFNASEIFGRGISQSISLTYYPSSDQAFGPFMEKYGYALGRDAITNVFREVFPDINQRYLHRRRKIQTQSP